MILLVDVCVAVPVGCLFGLCLLTGVAGAFLVQPPRELGWVFGLALLGSLAQYGVVWMRITRTVKEDLDAATFWRRVLRRYLFLGSTLYYFYVWRPRLLTLPREVQHKGLVVNWESQTFLVVRRLNRMWSPLFAIETVTLFCGLALELDTVVNVAGRVMSATFAVGILLWTFLTPLILHDAWLTRRQADPGYSQAEELFSSRRLAQGEENYLSARYSTPAKNRN